MGTYYSYQGYQPLKKGHSYNYGDFREDPNGDYVMPENLSGSDYGKSGTVGRSNYRVFMERFGKLAGVYALSGGYGTYAIVIHKARAAKHDEIRDVLNALEDYCVIDEEDHSQLQHELEEDVWESTVKREVREGVVEALEEFFNDPDKFVEDDCDLSTLFYECGDEIGEYWIHEETSPYIKVDEIIPVMVDRILAENLPKEKLPMLIAHEWHGRKQSPEAEIIYQKRLAGDPEYDPKEPIYTENSDGQTAFEFFYRET